jgi:hypothetical protein
VAIYSRMKFDEIRRLGEQAFLRGVIATPRFRFPPGHRVSFKEEAILVKRQNREIDCLIPPPRAIRPLDTAL